MMRKVTRREFIGTCVRWGAAAALLGMRPFSFFVSKKASASAGYPDLGVVSGENAGAMVKSAVDVLGGIGRFVKKGDTVVLKPNFSFSRAPSVGATTSPEVTEAVIKLCLEAEAGKIIVTDHPFGDAMNCAGVSGIEAVVRKFSGVSLLPGDREFLYQDYAVPGGKELKEVKVLKEAMKADVLINLPAAKSHSATGVSLSMKNLMGLVWDRGYFHTRINLDRGIADLSGLIRPHLIIMDLTRALVSGGPGGPGKVEKVNKVVAGTDPVAVDSYTVASIPWYGRSFRGDQVKHILAAAESGLGEIDTEKLKIAEKHI